MWRASLHRGSNHSHAASLSPWASTMAPMSIFGARSYAAPAPRQMFDKVLIANRGEIACRVMRTCKALGVRTVAVYSEADAKSLHVRTADEAVCVGPPPARESYLRADHIIEVAKRTGAQAIHPGYGFLSENEKFAIKCKEQGIEFIGPPPSAIESMGSKSASKEIMSKAKVPVVPGYHGNNQDPTFLSKEAEKIGFPILIKAVYGGGGKGMRIVNNASEFQDALNSAKREAMSSFADDRVLLEKYVTRPRHIEFQIFGDKYGDAVHLFERDCSVQRRHQKIIEEAPAPNMTEELRNTMGIAAVNAAKAVGYVGAGTVEFIFDCDTNEFYFMEMNTRLQVEHPITEMITGLDLVEWQLKVASGHRLPLQQNQLKINGHSFEARIYAENPAQNFLPGTGKLVHLSTPAVGPTLRVETGVRQGDEVSIFYDPMIAKLVVWDKDRSSALRKLDIALSQYKVVGLNTNIEFLRRLCQNKSFIKGDVETNFIPMHKADLFRQAPDPSVRTLSLAALHTVLEDEKATKIISNLAKPAEDPWSTLAGWRQQKSAGRQIKFSSEVQEGEEKRRQDYVVNVVPLAGGKYEMQVNKSETKGSGKDAKTTQVPLGEPIEVSGELGEDGEIKARIGTDSLPSAHVIGHDDNLHIFEGGQYQQLSQARVAYTPGAGAKGALIAPMPGKVISVLVQPGQEVKKGQPIVVMEAMKMEHTIRSPDDGVIKSVHCDADQFVVHNHVMVRMQE